MLQFSQGTLWFLIELGSFRYILWSQHATCCISLDAKGVIPEDHRLARGVLGVFGNAGTSSG